MKLFFFLALLLGTTASLIPAVSFALNLNLDYPAFGGLDLNTDQNPNSLIAWIYYFIVGIGGLAAFVMLVWGGVQWITSGAIPSQAGEARDKIKNAILGLLLILASFLIIQIINPGLTILQVPGFPLAVGQVPTLPLPPVGGSVIFSADGEPDLLCVSTPSTAIVELQWTSSNPGCQADSVPATTWDGAKPTSGPENVTLAAGSFDFLLSCGAISESVKVTVTTGSCSAGTPITVDLKARDSGTPIGSGADGSITFDTVNPASNNIPSGKIALDWTNSAGTAPNSCNTQGGPSNHFFATGRPLNSTWEQFLIGPAPGTYTYTITCTDTTGTQSATDSIDLIVF